MLAFIHINKTAGRTVRYILRSSFGPRHCEVEPWHAPWTGPPFSAEDLRRVAKWYPKLESIAGHRVTGYMDLRQDKKIRYFTFMREPLKTCASRFQYNVEYRGKKDLVFEDWIQKEWTRNSQTKLIAGTDDVDAAIRLLTAKQIFVGLTERFDESLLIVKSQLAPNLNISYERINVAKDNSLAKHVLTDKHCRQLLIDANQADLQLYEYVCQELYPAYQRAYGPALAQDLATYQQKQNQTFNQVNLALSRAKQYLLYKPLLYLYRKGVPVA